MSIMTQEQKAKAYDEAIERARYYQKENGSAVISAIFPELKESEDERIRKSLIDMLKNDEKCYLKEIAWLEKQGEQKLDGTFVNVDDVREDFIDEVYRVLNADPTNDRANQIIDAFDNLPTVTIKQDPCEHCQMTQLNCYSFPCDEKREFEQGKTALEAINEEKVDNQFCVKPVDKVKPKFKVGDWVINKLGDLWHIDSFDKKNYQVSDGKGNYNYFPISKQDEIHHWTILDVKDGNVLNSPSNRLIWIYKDNEHYHACVNMNYVTDNVATDDLLSIPKDACPATKDEQTILFARMKESGYEWDAKLKQLKKIEDEIEIPFGAKDSELIEESYYIPKGFHAEIDEDKVVIKKGEKPTEWSEDDKKKRNLLINILNVNHPNGFFKVNPANTLNMEAIHTEELVDWLKSLRPQNIWKPSAEQMTALRQAISGCSYDVEPLVELETKLKGE